MGKQLAGDVPSSHVLLRLIPMLPGGSCRNNGSKIIASFLCPLQINAANQAAIMAVGVALKILRERERTLSYVAISTDT